jgi:hypothetical protein
MRLRGSIMLLVLLLLQASNLFALTADCLSRTPGCGMACCGSMETGSLADCCSAAGEDPIPAPAIPPPAPTGRELISLTVWVPLHFVFVSLAPEPSSASRCLAQRRQAGSQSPQAALRVLHCAFLI